MTRPASTSSRAAPAAGRLLTEIAELRRRTRRHLLVRGLMWLVLGLVGASGVQLLVDRAFRLSVDQRGVLNVLITIAWLYVIWRFLLRPLWTPLSDSRLAEWVDAANPDLHDRVQTAVEFARGGVHGGEMSPELVAEVLREADVRVTPAAFKAVLDQRAFRQRATVAAVVSAFVLGLFVFMPGMMRTWFQRNWFLQDVEWPQSTYILPVGYDALYARSLPRGEPVELEAEIVGYPPRTATLVWETASGRSGREPLTQVGGRRLTGSLGILTEDLRFRILGGDERTREYLIRAVDRPQVRFTRIEVTPPVYTAEPPLVFEQQTSVEVLAGARLQVTAQLNKPVAAAEFVSDEDVVPAGIVTALEDGPHGPQIVLHWAAPESGLYRFKLVDRDGLHNRNPLRYALKVVDDAPPTVELEFADVSDLVTPNAELRTSVAARDAYGLSEVALALQRNEQAARSAELPTLSGVARQYTAQYVCAVEALGATPGDRLRFVARAADRDPAGPNVGESRTVDFAVVSREEYHDILAQRELELRNEFERLLTAQRTLGEQLDAMGSLLPEVGAAAAREAQQLLTLARRQAGHAARCGSIGQRYLAMLGEMRTNRVARPQDERRISARVVAPLNTLQHESMPALVDAVRALRTDANAPNRATCAAAQARILREMQFVYQNMLEWEGYREAVATLEAIIEAQGEVRTATLEALERQLDDILGLDDLGAPPVPSP